MNIVKNETNVINNLNNMRVLPITEFEKSIVEIYHIVFNEYPDFSKKEDIFDNELLSGIVPVNWTPFTQAVLPDNIFASVAANIFYVIYMF